MDDTSRMKRISPTQVQLHPVGTVGNGSGDGTEVGERRPQEQLLIENEVAGLADIRRHYPGESRKGRSRHAKYQQHQEKQQRQQPNKTPIPGAYRIDSTGTVEATSQGSSSLPTKPSNGSQQPPPPRRQQNRFRIDPTGAVINANQTSYENDNNDNHWMMGLSRSASSELSSVGKRFSLEKQPSDERTETDRDFEEDDPENPTHRMSLGKNHSKNNLGATTLLEATPVVDDILLEQDGKDIVAVTAEEDSSWAFFKRSRCAQVSIFVSCFLIVALALGLSLVFFNQSISASGVGEPQFFAQLGSALDGHGVANSFGLSLGMNGNGQRMVVADFENVYVYDWKETTMEDSVGKVDWVLSTTIQAPMGATAGQGSHHIDIIRNTVQVDVSEDGAYIAIGWPYATNANGEDPSTGRVQVYQQVLGLNRWQEIGNTLYGWSSQDFFGTSLSLSANGGTLSVGSPGNMGHAHVYRLNNNVWMQQGNLTESIPAGNLQVGSVSLSSTGNVLAIGGRPRPPGESAVAASSNAVVRIFRFMAGDWVELGDGILGNLEDTAYIMALSADGTIVALSNYYTGEYSPAEGEMNDALDVRVFEWNGNEWTQLGENLHAFAPGEKSGYFITLSDDGKLMGMGDPGRRSEEGGGVAGHVHIFQYSDSNQEWKQIGPNRDGDAPGDQFGSAVALSGDGRRFAASAPFNRGSGIELGRVYAFDLDNLDEISN